LRTQHIALGHAAVLAGAGTEPAARLLSAISLAAAGMATPALEPPRRRQPLRAQAPALRGRLPARAAAPALAFGVDAGNQLLGHHGAAVGHHDLGQHAGCRCRHFQHHLVGFDLDQDFIDRHQRHRPSSSIAASWLRPRIRTAAGL
jgi:anti-sigma factor RsiW